MIDWLFRRRPAWLGRFAGFLVWGLDERIPLPTWSVPYLVGLQLGRQGHMVKR
jgi:hypothetical protein